MEVFLSIHVTVHIIMLVILDLIVTVVGADMARVITDQLFAWVVLYVKCKLTQVWQRYLFSCTNFVDETVYLVEDLYSFQFQKF